MPRLRPKRTDAQVTIDFEEIDRVARMRERAAEWRRYVTNNTDPYRPASLPSEGWYDPNRDRLSSDSVVPVREQLEMLLVGGTLDGTWVRQEFYRTANGRGYRFYVNYHRRPDFNYNWTRGDLDAVVAPLPIERDEYQVDLWVEHRPGGDTRTEWRARYIDPAVPTQRAMNERERYEEYRRVNTELGRDYNREQQYYFSNVDRLEW